MTCSHTNNPGSFRTLAVRSPKVSLNDDQVRVALHFVMMQEKKKQVAHQKEVDRAEEASQKALQSHRFWRNFSKSWTSKLPGRDFPKIGLLRDSKWVEHFNELSKATTAAKNMWSSGQSLERMAMTNKDMYNRIARYALPLPRPQRLRDTGSFHGRP